MVKCSICSSESKLLFRRKILQKYDIQYFACSECGFLFTEKPYWLAEAYSEAITSTDLGLVKRNLYFSSFVEDFLLKLRDLSDNFVDYAGGYGLFVRLMRDKGFLFYRIDPFCPNLFAKGFDVDTHSEITKRFGLLTAFEVMEHLEDPISEVQKMLEYSDVILFSTELQPTSELESWWYISPHTGQHISFFTQESLSYIARHLSLFFYTDKVSLHVFSRKKLLFNPFRKKSILLDLYDKIFLKSKKKQLVSLLNSDHEMVLAKYKKP